MQIKTFNADPHCMLVQVQDDGPDPFAPRGVEDLEVRTDLELSFERPGPARMEAEGTVTIMSRGDGKQLFAASYPDTRAAAIFIESGQTGELDLEHVKLVRNRSDMTLTLQPLSPSVHRSTRMTSVKALMLANALRMCANHHRLFPERSR